MNRHNIILSVLLISTVCSANPPSDTQASPRQEPKWDLSVSAFIEEMCYSQGCARTPRFDDYTEGSYHVRKLPLVNEITRRNTNDSARVEAVIVLGPSGPLWQYNLVTIVGTNRNSKILRVNHLVYPHARITRKATRLVPRDDVESALELLMMHPGLRDVRAADHAAEAEWDTMATVARFGDSVMTKILPDSAQTDEAVDVKTFYEAVNKLLGGDAMTTTYTTVIETGAPTNGW